jgi:hypothetical protein
MTGKLTYVASIGEAAARGCGDFAVRRSRYGIDGGAIVAPLFGVLQVGLAGTVLWAIRHRRRSVARRAGIVGMVRAVSAASYLYPNSPPSTCQRAG